jgi:heavy metal sensor kinase
MYLRKILSIRHTLAFRLTLWYAGIFTISSLVAFIVLYFMIASALLKNTDQELLEKIGEFSSILALKGIDEVKSKAVFEAQNDGEDKIFFRILGSNGEEIAASDMSSWGDVGINTTGLKQLINGTNHVFETLATPEHPHKVRTLYGIIGPGTFLQVGWSLEDEAQFLKGLQETFIPIMAVLIVFAALIGWFMARRALLGVEEVTRTALDISNGALERRVPVKTRGDEIDRLASTFNTMVDRIHALITGMREMSDNIAHELRSPITRIRGIAETTLIAGKSTDEYEIMAANTIEECDRLLGMINTMLDISEFEAGTGNLAMEKIDIAGVVRDACELFQPVAEDKGITLILKAPVSCHINGETQRLQRMVANLLDNAVKYTPSEGTVTVSVNEDKGQVLFSVSDTGIGISEHDLPHVFKRFYRCDQSRPQTGSGLGLTLALAIARAHGGNITATSCPGKGSTFTATFPRLPLTH